MLKNERAAPDARPENEEAAGAVESPAAAPLPPPAAASLDTSAEPQMDADGLRILTLETVRKEIWLNHGSMETKRLMKVFDVKKKSSQERRDLFRKIVKDLCSVQHDPVKGNMLVLKQHWSHMG